MITKKEYLKLAQALAKTRPLRDDSRYSAIAYRIWSNLREEIVKICHDSNPWFNEELFIQVTNQDQGEIK